MTEATEKKHQNALVQLASKISVNPDTVRDTLMKTTCKDLNAHEFVVFVAMANTYNLNPLAQQIFAFKGKGGAVRPVVPIDGWIKIVNDRKDFDGVEFDYIEDPESQGGLKGVTCRIYVKGKAKPFTVTEWMNECFDASKEPWKRWPRRMLRHKAYIQCARLAFGLSGIYDQDEAERIIDVEVTDTLSTKPETTAPEEVSRETQPEQQEMPTQHEQTQKTTEMAIMTVVGAMNAVIGEVINVDGVLIDMKTEKKRGSTFTTFSIEDKETQGDAIANTVEISILGKPSELLMRELEQGAMLRFEDVTVAKGAKAGQKQYSTAKEPQVLVLVGKV